MCKEANIYLAEKRNRDFKLEIKAVRSFSTVNSLIDIFTYQDIQRIT